MTLRPALLPGLAAILLFSHASAQEDGERDVPVFRAGVVTVVVDTLVLDRDGSPVSNLGRDDFEVLENGVAQTLSSFEVTDWTSYLAARSTDTPAGEVSVNVNLHPRRFILVLNRQGAEFGDLARAKRALADFVVESLADGDEAMVIDIGYATKIIQEFQPQKEVTLQAIRALSQMEMDYPLDAYRASRQIYGDLESIAQSLGQMPGRKIMIFLSPELATFVPVGSRYADQAIAMKEAIQALNQANATVYTIDLYGARVRGGGGNAIYGGLSPLASETGGRFFKNTVSFEPALRRIGRENQRYYLLGYSPTAEPDGTYREIEVKVSRPDVEVVARKGYFARLPEARGGDTDTDTASSKEMPPSTPADLPLAVEVTTYLLPTGVGTVRVPVSVALPEELLSGDDAASHIELGILTPDGEALHVFEEEVSLQRYFVMRQVDLRPGPYVIAIRLRSGSRAFYSSDTPIQIPVGFGDRFGLSSIVPVVSPDAARSVGAGELPILPTATVSRGEEAYVLFQVFPGNDAPSEHVRVTYAVRNERDASVLSGGPEDPIALLPVAGGTPVILSLPTRSLEYGRYRVEIRVEDEARGRRAASEIEIRIR